MSGMNLVMEYKIDSFSNIKDKYLKRKIYNLNKYLLKQNEKVAYAYKNLVTNDMLAFNFETCFYSASAIKFLVCLYLYEQAESDIRILDKKVTLTQDDFKGGSGVLKNNQEKLEYTVRELIYYSLKESDNTAYIKLVNLVTADKLKEYGMGLGTKHTLEGKDLFGITSASDMMIYLTHLFEYFKTESKLSNELKSYMANPTYEVVNDKSINNKPFIRKYGRFGIAFHEVGIVLDKEGYILIILTQKNELDDKVKIKYVNEVAMKITKIHNLLKDKRSINE